MTPMVGHQGIHDKMGMQRMGREPFASLFLAVPGLFWRDTSKRCKCGTKERQKRCGIT